MNFKLKRLPVRSSSELDCVLVQRGKTLTAPGRGTSAGQEGW